MNNINTRDARRIIRELRLILSATPIDALPHVAKGLAQSYNLPQRVMLKAMARFTRITRT
jgi:hypothetical protein